MEENTRALRHILTFVSIIMILHDNLDNYLIIQKHNGCHFTEDKSIQLQFEIVLICFVVKPFLSVGFKWGRFCPAGTFGNVWRHSGFLYKSGLYCPFPPLRGERGWESGAGAQREEQSNTSCCLRGSHTGKKEKSGGLVSKGWYP